MRTIKRYEAKDIKEDNKVHTFILAGITLAMLQTRNSTKGSIHSDMKEAIACFLNLAADLEIEIVDRDEVPAVFRNGFTEEVR
jgi:hypothetical protein